MSRRLAFTPAAGADVAEAYDWQEEQRPGLGEAFRAELAEALALLTEFSEAGPVVHRDLHRLLLRRFPYALYYRVGADVVEVRGCLHLHRDPRAWRRRA